MSEEIVEKNKSEVDLGEDHYAQHLADVNEDNEVLSTGDIRNSKGVLLVKKGARIDNRAVKKIVQHKLTRPLEDQIAINDSIDNKKLLDHSNSLLDKYHDIQTIISDNEMDKEVNNVILGCSIPTIIFQNLTVLSHQQEDVFEKSVFSAVFAAMLAIQLRLPVNEQQNVYLATLVHDLGLLRISPDILNKKEQLSSEEWRAIQSHVVIGELMFKSIKGVPSSVSRAVLEHHERCDGTGYPAGKNESGLETFGQIVGLADSIQAIRVNQFEKKGLNLANATPYLQLNSTTFFHSVYRAAHMLVKNSTLQPATHIPGNKHSRLALDLLGKTEGLKNIIAPLRSSHDIMEALKARKRGGAVIRISSRLIERISSSGIFSKELTEWIKSVEKESAPGKSDLAELTYTNLMLNELTWQLESVRKNLGEYVDHECVDKDNENYAVLQENLEKMANCLTVLK